MQVDKFNKYLHDNYVWTDREEFFKLLLRGVDDGILQVRKGWNKNKEHEQYMKVMEAVVVFTDIVAIPKLRCLDFQDVPRSIRHRMIEMIPRFAGLRTLIIGPGNSGSWVPIKVILPLTHDNTLFIIQGQSSNRTFCLHKRTEELGAFLLEEGL